MARFPARRYAHCKGAQHSTQECAATTSAGQLVCATAHISHMQWHVAALLSIVTPNTCGMLAKLHGQKTGYQASCCIASRATAQGSQVVLHSFDMHGQLSAAAVQLWQLCCHHEHLRALLCVFVSSQSSQLLIEPRHENAAAALQLLGN